MTRPTPHMRKDVLDEGCTEGFPQTSRLRNHSKYIHSLMTNRRNRFVVSHLSTPELRVVEGDTYIIEGFSGQQVLLFSYPGQTL